MTIGRIALWLIAGAVAIHAGGVGALHAAQGSFIFRRDGRTPDDAAAGPELRAIRIRTEDGFDLAAWFLPPPPGQPTLPRLHGNGGNLGGRIGRVRRFANRGWGLLFLGYRGFGGNAGVPNKGGLAMDARGALAASGERGIDPSRVAVFGEALGTGVAVRLAAWRPVAAPVGAVILDLPYTSVADVAQMQYPFAPVRALIAYPFNFLSRIAAIRAPLLIIQGARDDVMPSVMGQAVCNAAAEPKEIWTSPNGGHADVVETGGEAVAAAFIARPVTGG